MFNLFKKYPAQLPYVTDIHSHLLPGVDDGSPDVSTSVELVERMKSWGVKRIITTPHVTNGTFENTPDKLDRALVSLLEALERRNIDIELTRSAEYRIDDLFKMQLDEGLVTPLPGNFLLVENSFMQEPPELDEFLYDLKIKGYRPILAHPERYIYYSKYNPRRYEKIYRSGTFLQINVLSLAGFYGKEEKRMAEELLEKGYVDFLGTDLHSHRHADAIEAYIGTRRFHRLCRKLHLINDTSF